MRLRMTGVSMLSATQRSFTRDGECRIVKIDHEEILCNYRVKVVAELSPSFERLLMQTIKEGEAE